MIRNPLQLSGVLVLACLSLPEVRGQSAKEFIQAYNYHIDPNNRLDSFNLLTQTLKTTIYLQEDLNHSIIKQTNRCYFGSSGLKNCIDIETGRKMQMDVIQSLGEIPENNQIKFQLNFIFLKDIDNQFQMIIRNDSISQIEEIVDSKNRRIYTFDSKSLNLMQLKSIRIRNDTEFIRYTSFTEYVLINDILVPSKGFYSNDFCNASIEYDSVSFHTELDTILINTK